MPAPSEVHADDSAAGSSFGSTPDTVLRYSPFICTWQAPDTRLDDHGLTRVLHDTEEFLTTGLPAQFTELKPQCHVSLVCCLAPLLCGRPVVLSIHTCRVLRPPVYSG